MKKYVSKATKWLGIVTLLCGVVLLVGVILAFVKMITVSIVMITSGVMFAIFFFTVFFAEKSRALIIDNEKIIFPRGANKNGRMVLEKTTVKFCDIASIGIELYKGDGFVSKDTNFYTLKLKNRETITVTLYAYGKKEEKEILEIIKKSIS